MLTKSLSKDGGKIKSLQRDCQFQRAITDACLEHILMSSILIVRFCEIINTAFSRTFFGKMLHRKSSHRRCSVK